MFRKFLAVFQSHTITKHSRNYGFDGTRFKHFIALFQAPSNTKRFLDGNVEKQFHIIFIEQTICFSNYFCRYSVLVFSSDSLCPCIISVIITHLNLSNANDVNICKDDLINVPLYTYSLFII